MTIWCLYSNVSSTLILLSDLDNAREAIKTRFSISDPRWYAWIMTSRNRPSKPLVSEKAKPRNVGSKTLHRLTITLTAPASGQRGTGCWYFVIRKSEESTPLCQRVLQVPFLYKAKQSTFRQRVFEARIHTAKHRPGGEPLAASQPASQLHMETRATTALINGLGAHQRSGFSPTRAFPNGLAKDLSPPVTHHGWMLEPTPSRAPVELG